MRETRPGAGRIVRTASLGALYLIGVGLNVLWPTRVTTPFRVYLDSLRSVIPYGDTLLEIGANVALFVPVGLLAAWWLPQGKRWLGFVAGVALSASAELAQATLLPDRVASARDVLANSIGVLIGILLVELRQLRATATQGT